MQPEGRDATHDGWVSEDVPVGVQPRAQWLGRSAQYKLLDAAGANAARRPSNPSSTFTDNMRLPVHGWFRFSAGFSADWVRAVVKEYARGSRKSLVLDPFAGVGTSMLASEEAGIPSVGVEAHPFISRITQTKLLWHTSPDDFLRFARGVLEKARTRDGSTNGYPPLICKCYPSEVLSDLDRLRRGWEALADGTPASELTWLAICAILRQCSPVKTAPWQYILPGQRKGIAVPTPWDAFATQVDRMASDMMRRQAEGACSCGRLMEGDARDCADVADDSVSLVVTSPPYANNYDYADATRLEMSFFGQVNGWADLHSVVRKRLVRSCSQHVSADDANLDLILASFSDSPIRMDLESVCQRLDAERPLHGGKKDYHLMVAAYFQDMRQVWAALRRVCRDGAMVCFVVGDSAPYGVHVPVDKWLAQLALAAGFQASRFEKLRDRNTKWLNRKHRVPLQEGRLWVEG